ncbi:MAG: hypothetical protein AAGE88_18080 [Actinomycetota bacterium]
MTATDLEPYGYGADDEGLDGLVNQRPPGMALPSPVTDAGSESTKVEMARAVAEIYAAVASAQQIPRRPSVVRQRMRASTDSYKLSEVAFYKVPRGGQTATGLTVKAARELGVCYGNFRYGMAELNRDDDLGRSEMMAWAWDLEANAWMDSKFIVPHRRDVTVNGQKQQKPLLSLQDIRESNTNMAARAMRSVILALLPPHYVDEAEERLKRTLERGPKGEDIEVRRTKAAAAFERLGVSQSQIETKLGRSIDDWDGYDLAELTIIRGALARREITAADEFPPEVTLSDLPPVPTVDPPAAEEPTAAPPEAQVEPPADPDGDGQPDADRPTQDDLRAALKAKKITVPNALKQVRKMHGDGFATLESVANHAEAGLDLADWIDQQ